MVFNGGHNYEMHYRRDLYDDLAEVHVDDIAQRGQKASPVDALQLAKMILKEVGDNDAIVGQLPSPLIAQPVDLQRYMVCEQTVEQLALSKPYSIVRGGMYLTKSGRIIIVEFKNRIDESISQRYGQNASTGPKQVPLTPRTNVQKAPTEDMPKPGQTQDTYQVDPVVVGLTNHDEGSTIHVTILSRSHKLFAEDWNPDRRFKDAAVSASFHMGSEHLPANQAGIKGFRPMTQERYNKLSIMVNKIRQNPRKPVTPPQAPTQAQPKRRKLFGMF